MQMGDAKVREISTNDAAIADGATVRLLEYH
jgi:hypothetical protein